MPNETTTAPAEQMETPHAEAEAAQAESIDVSNVDTSASSEPETIKGLSLWQPWASLIALGQKRIETRSWSTDYRGLVAIHATKTLNEESRRAIAENNAIEAAMASHGLTADTLPLGGIIAVVEIVDCVEFDGSFQVEHPEGRFGDFTPGRFGFRLANVRLLPEPIPCAGAQKLFDLKPEIVDKLRTALGRIAAPVATEPAKEPAPTPSPEPEKVGSTTTERLDDRPDPELWHAIQEARTEERNAEGEVAELAEDLKAAKKRHEVASERLGKLIDEAREPGLFSQQQKVSAAHSASNGSAEKCENIPNFIPDAKTEPDDTWRSVLIESLEPKLTPGKLKSLSERTPPILTMGDMADHQQRHGDFWVKEISKFGVTGAEQYALAADRYWAEHPQPSTTPAAGKLAPVLKWESVSEDDESPCWIAESAVRTEVDGTPTDGALFWQLDLMNDGLWVAFESPGRLTGMTETEKPQGWKELSEAWAWCQLRENELLADHSVDANKKVPDDAAIDIATDHSDAAAFADDATIIPETVEKVIDSDNCKIEVSQTVGGRWNCATAGTIWKISFTGAAGMISAPTREEAIAAGANKIHDWLRATMNGGKGTKAMREQSAEILRLLDGLDKSQAQKATA